MISLRHIGIVVQDIDVALNFWVDILGFKVVRRELEQGEFIDKLLGLSNVVVTTVKMRSGAGSQIELLKFDSHKDIKEWAGKPYSTGLTHVALEVQDLDKEFQRLLKLGIQFIGNPSISPDGGAKVVYALGPEKLLLEFVEVLSL